MSSYPIVDFQDLPPSLAPSGSGRLSYSAAPVALPAAANSTPTTAQLANGTFDNSAATGVNTMTLPTAANMVAALNGAVVGTSFVFYVIGDAGSALTVAAGTGGSTSGSMSVSALTSGCFRVRLTNVTSGSEAYELARLS